MAEVPVGGSWQSASTRPSITHPQPVFGGTLSMVDDRALSDTCCSGDPSSCAADGEAEVPRPRAQMSDLS
jgi:hypothetical protein